MFTEQWMWVTFESEHIYLFTYLGFWRVCMINDFHNFDSHLFIEM